MRVLSRKLRDWQEESEEIASKLGEENEELLGALDVATIGEALEWIRWLKDLEKIASSCGDNSAEFSEAFQALRSHLATAPKK